MKKTKRIMALALGMMLTTATFAGCAKTGTPAPTTTTAPTTSAVTTPAPTTTGNKQIKIGLSMNTLNNPFFVDVKSGVEKAAKENNAILTITDAQNSAATQVSDIENLIAQKPDVIIIDPADSDAITAAVESCNKANIPVITMDRESNGGIVAAHIGYDAIKSGNLAGDYVAQQLKSKTDAKVVEIQGIMGTNVAQNRSKGFNEAMARNNLKIIAKQAADFDRAKAMSVMENILQANPKIDAVYAANDEMALGALEAIKASGRLKDIVLIGCDAIDPSLEKIRAGELNATIAEPPFFLGKKGVETALSVLKGEKVEKTVYLQSTLVTKANVDTIKTKE